MKQRHQDYQLTIPTVPVGGLTDIALRLDTDAPFLLRQVRSRNLGLNGFRWQTANRQWQSSALRTDVIPQPPNGALPNPQPSRGVVVYPEMFFPIGGVIVCEVGNATNAPLSNVKLLFRGSKVFADGAINMADYPARMSPMPYTYPLVVPGLGATELRQELPWRNKNDADFVIRYGACDAFTLGQDGGVNNPFSFTNLYVTVRDEWFKAYSNEPIHVNDVFGQGQPTPYQTSTANDDDVMWMPGMFSPEIYVIRDHSLFFDFVRQDVGSGPVDLHVRFQGAKVFAR